MFQLQKFDFHAFFSPSSAMSASTSPRASSYSHLAAQGPANLWWKLKVPLLAFSLLCCSPLSRVLLLHLACSSKACPKFPAGAGSLLNYPASSLRAACCLSVSSLPTLRG